MIKTFLSEFKWVFKSPWRIIELIILLFIPFMYGFLYTNAYWNPFGHTQKLRIAIVNKDSKSPIATALAKTLTGVKHLKAGPQKYTINIKALYNAKDPEGLVQNNEQDAVLVIPEKFTKVMNTQLSSLNKQFKEEVIKKIDLSKIITGKFNLGIKTFIQNHVLDIKDAIERLPKIEFYNSYKNNFLAGEMTNFGASLMVIWRDAFMSNFINLIDQDIKERLEKQGTIGQAALKIIKDNEAKIKSIIKQQLNKIRVPNLIHYDNIGSNIKTYGMGMAPYFISIAIWVGALVMTFMFKNTRRKGAIDVSTVKHYLGKSMVWIIVGWIQATILLIALQWQGVKLADNQIYLYLFTYFIVIIFTMMVQAISYTLRYGDLGEFAAMILLVLQLISSSGTFPVDMQGEIFKVIHPLIPFTYSVSTFRELFFEPSTKVILINVGILLIYLSLVPISISINMLFDKKHKRFDSISNKYIYESFEIHLDDK